MESRNNSAITILDNIQTIKHGRLMRVSNPKVITYQGKDDIPLVREGSVTAFFAKKGSKILNELEDAFGNNDDVLIGKLTQKIWEDIGTRKPYTLLQSEKIIAREPVMAELRYGSKQLSDNLVVPRGIDFGVVVLPYNGGKLLDTDFTVVEYNNYNNLEEQLEFVLVKREPELTDLEKETLLSVPDHMLEMNISSGVLTWITVAVVLVLVITVLTAMGSACVKGSKVALSAEEIKALGPLASARELLNLRRQSFYN